ncbi:MAG: hypothetical protein ACI8PZ_004870 [Myxococcota bacterium]|jgi:hypothetical protein
MTLPPLDPHPHGCPLALAVTPAQMPDAVRGICRKVSDLLSPALHVIDPSRGHRYPILSLYASESDPTPRIVLFPGWESNSGSRRRRIGFARQVTLLQRITEAGVHGEAVNVENGDDPDSDPPLTISLACTAVHMPGQVRDLYDYLGDRVRMTVTLVDGGPGAGEVPVLRVYSPFRDQSPRLVLVPAWTGIAERSAARIAPKHRDSLVEELADGSAGEVEVEDYLGLA